MLGRTAARRRELAIRTALGAARVRLIRQIVTEAWCSPCLAARRACCSRSGRRSRSSRSPQARFRPAPESASTCACCCSPWSWRRSPRVLQVCYPPSGIAAAVGDSLREGGRQGPAGSRRTLNMLVAAEVALALVLLTGAGCCCARSGLQSVERGFSADRIGLATVSLPGLPTVRRSRRAFYCAVHRARARDSRVEFCGTDQRHPHTACCQFDDLRVSRASRCRRRSSGSSTRPNTCPRLFRDHRRAPGRRGTSRTRTALARCRWRSSTRRSRAASGREDPVGKRLKPGDGTDNQPWIMVIGVVNDLRRGDVSVRYAARSISARCRIPLRTQVVVFRTAADTGP